MVRVIGCRTRRLSLCCGQLSLSRRLFAAAAVAAGKSRRLCSRGNSASSAGLSRAPFATPRALGEGGGLSPFRPVPSAEGNGRGRGARRRRRRRRLCYRWLGFSGSRASRARNFFLWVPLGEEFSVVDFAFFNKSYGCERSRLLPALFPGARQCVLKGGFAGPPRAQRARIFYRGALKTVNSGC